MNFLNDHNITGWLLDVYPNETNLTVWLIGEDGQRCRFFQDFSASLYAAGPPRACGNSGSGWQGNPFVYACRAPSAGMCFRRPKSPKQPIPRGCYAVACPLRFASEIPFWDKLLH